MIDAHCHLSFKKFNPDRADVIERSAEDLEAIIDCAVTQGTIMRSLEMSEKYEMVHSTLGIHPAKAGRMTRENVDTIRRLIEENMDKIVALGEAGLEYFHTNDPGEHQRQKEIFRLMIDMARDHDMPLVIHARDAEEEALRMVSRASLENVLFHCYGGDIKTAKMIIDRGYKISLATNICYSEDHRGLVGMIPLGSLLLETDSPYLSPFKAMKRNEPINVKESALVVSQVKEIPETVVEAETARNTREFYGL
jgi:TatD DNase family protein